MIWNRHSCTEKHPLLDPSLRIHNDKGRSQSLSVCVHETQLYSSGGCVAAVPAASKPKKCLHKDPPNMDRETQARYFVLSFTVSLEWCFQSVLWGCARCACPAQPQSGCRGWLVRSSESAEGWMVASCGAHLPRPFYTTWDQASLALASV